MKNIIEAKPQTLNALAKRKINTNEDLVNLLPRKYVDYRHQYTELSPELNGKTGVFIGRLSSLKTSSSNKRSVVTAKLTVGGIKVSVTYIGQKFMEKILNNSMGCVAAFFGTISYTEKYGYSILSPDKFYDLDSTGRSYQNQMKLVPIYRKFGGISVEMMDSLRRAAFENGFDYSLYTLSEEDGQEVTGHLLPDYRNAFLKVHYPSDDIDIATGKLKIIADKMYDYCTRLAMQDAASSNKGIIVPTEEGKAKIKKFIEELPFPLTADQKTTTGKIIEKVNKGERVSALVQGDVGCGKTMVAFISLLYAVFNGYQAMICAPTDILATQHYDQLVSLGERYGFSVAYLGSKTKAKDKEKILEGLSSGKIDIVAGTHSLCSDKIEYNNLGFVAVDEEHRFGTEQKNALMKRAHEGVNVISMSATPIPRSMAMTMFGSGLDIYDIHSMPEGRSPIGTHILSDDNIIAEAIRRQLNEGRQAYIVCPLIEKDDENERMAEVDSVEEIFEKYSKLLPEFKIGLLNGKMKPSEIEDTVMRFKNKEFHILISTTVVEVGVNVPNASVMVISNAERFGLATLHQLRGRVGRGEYKGFCLLRSKLTDNERLLTMTQTTDGFEIAKKDLEMRGAGNLIGNEQSGFTEILSLSVQYPGLFGKIKEKAYQNLKNVR